MNIEAVALTGVSASLASCVLSAYFWNRAKWLRKLPILVTVSGFTIYHFAIPSQDHSFAFLLAISFLLGFIFYFAVWIQCKNQGDGFL